MAYHRRLDVDWDDEDSIGWLLYIRSSRNVLDIPAGKVTSRERKVSDVQMRKWVGVVPVRFNPDQKKTHEDAARDVSSVFGSSVDFLDPANDMPVSEDGIFEKDALWDLRDLAFKDSAGPSALQRVQELCQAYGLAVPSDVRAVQKLLKDALAALDCIDKDRGSLANLHKELKSENTECKE